MRSRRRLAVILSAAAVLAFATALPTGPATAQGLFDFLFNAFRRPQTPPPGSHADPRDLDADRPARPSRQGVEPRGKGLSYCVRLCDGRHFPINYRRGAAAVEICSALCPAANTKVFSGSSIETAVASDGTSYGDLPSAFAYRSDVVSGCTCNGNDSFGLAQIDAKKDPTLREGDIVATPQGFVVTGRTKQSISFSPLKGEMRSKLLSVKITPARAANKGTRSGDIRIKTGIGQKPIEEKQPETTGRGVRSVGPVPFPVGEAATDGKAQRDEP